MASSGHLGPCSLHPMKRCGGDSQRHPCSVYTVGRGNSSPRAQGARAEQGRRARHVANDGSCTCSNPGLVCRHAASHCRRAAHTRAVSCLPRCPWHEGRLQARLHGSQRRGHRGRASGATAAAAPVPAFVPGSLLLPLIQMLDPLWDPPRDSGEVAPAAVPGGAGQLVRQTLPWLQ